MLLFHVVAIVLVVLLLVYLSVAMLAPEVFE